VIAQAIVVIFLSALCTVPVRAQTVRVITADSVYVGTIITDSASFIVIQTGKDKILFQRDQIIRVERPFLGNKFVFGGTLGTPGGLNFIAGHYWDRSSIRVEAGYMGRYAGIQCDVSNSLYRGVAALLEGGIYVGAGLDTYTEFKGVGGPVLGEYWFHMGFSLAVNAGGFFLEAGLPIVNSEYRDQYGMEKGPPVIVQIGYVH